jgi:uncharacterized BrkB/YihY/UPF0761 family membrane protein
MSIFFNRRKYYEYLGEEINDENKDLTDQERQNIKYYSGFGFSLWNGELRLSDKDMLESALEKAWENRNYEIDKFWSRAAYFWAFLALIFGAYFTVVSKNMSLENPYLELYLICLGVVFSVGWIFVIKGSKRWQENWERHIDKLEDWVTGPLYKTIYSEYTYYSVSKINEV